MHSGRLATTDPIRQAARTLLASGAVLVSGGRGADAERGMPDYRIAGACWQGHPRIGPHGIAYRQVASPAFLLEHPDLAWAMYGEMVNRYRTTPPDRGLAQIASWVEQLAVEAFVVTSNIDGQFQKAGFRDEQVYEIHGSIFWRQCAHGCRQDVWHDPAPCLYDALTRLPLRVPRCPSCRKAARPAILLHADQGCPNPRRTQQAQRFERFREQHRHKGLAVLEVGVPDEPPVLRRLSQWMAVEHGATVIRLHPEDHRIGSPHIGLPGHPEATLTAIGEALDSHEASRPPLDTPRPARPKPRSPSTSPETRIGPDE